MAQKWDYAVITIVGDQIVSTYNIPNRDKTLAGYQLLSTLGR